MSGARVGQSREYWEYTGADNLEEEDCAELEADLMRRLARGSEEGECSEWDAAGWSPEEGVGKAILPPELLQLEYLLYQVPPPIRSPLLTTPSGAPPHPLGLRLTQADQMCSVAQWPPLRPEGDADVSDGRAVGGGEAADTCLSGAALDAVAEQLRAECTR